MSGRVVIVTGAAGGIGQALVARLVAAGDRVLATDLAGAGLRAVAERYADGSGEAHGEQVRVRPLDVRQGSDWEAAFDAAEASLGAVDVLINNAGCLTPGWIHEMASDDIARQFDVNAKGVALGTAAAARRMVARGAGHIVNVASLAALAPISGLAVYSASKYAVRALSLAAALDLAPHGVAVSVVCPDAVRTAMLDVQRDRAEAAMTFTGVSLDAGEVARVIVDEVLRRRPREVYLPRRRGWLARAADVFPALAARLDGPMRRKGRARQVADQGTKE